MAESQSHIKLVNELVNWISVTHLSGDSGSILVDSPNSNRMKKPPLISDHCPDVFVPKTNSFNMIIGEAKTLRDVETVHTINQFKAFLKFCELNHPSLFVLAVPWPVTRLARNLVKNIQVKTDTRNVRTFILENLRG